MAKLGIVDARLNEFAEPQRTALLKTANFIREILPDAEECISYNLPAFRIAGGVVCGIEGYKRHNSFFPFSGGILSEFESELATYETTKGELHFSPGKPLPKALIKKLIEARILQIESKAKK
jgi:uncharacterized protein YdhG (YjbR/CyaY superfamily)